MTTYRLFPSLLIHATAVHFIIIMLVLFLIYLVILVMSMAYTGFKRANVE